jgi:hypothetical protein
VARFLEREGILEGDCERNTRYGWVVSPYLTATCTL